MSCIPIYEVKLVRHIREVSQPVERTRVHGPGPAANQLCEFLHGADRENLVAMLLDTQSRLIGVHTSP